MKPRVAIIYICYKSLEYLPEVASSWAGQDYPSDRLAVVMVPNGSPDGIADVIRTDILPRAGKDLPETLHLIDDGENGGFASGNNKGIRWAQEHGYDYVYLNNGDLKLEPTTISKAVELAESDQAISAVQSLMLFWNDPQKVNSTGGMIHVGGYGYARDNGALLSEINRNDGEEIMYPSGAASLFRVSALNKVGLLEEGFFMYHEDLELGLRLRIAGYKNLLSMQSRGFHDYEFSRNPNKFQWMETYRYNVMLAYLKPLSIVVWFPFGMVIEIGSWIMAIKGRWLKAKVRATIESAKPTNSWFTARMRKRAKQLRAINDRDWLKDVTGVIEGQEVLSPMMQIANGIINPLWKAARNLIRW